MEDEIKIGGEAPSPETPPSDALGAMLSSPALLQGLASPTGDGLSALLSNPTLLARLPQIMAAIKPMMGSIPPTGQGAVERKEAPTPTVCREQLLLALKPFLSHERCEAVDTILRLSNLSAVFQMLK